MTREAVGIVQPDATIVGGITEWLRVTTQPKLVTSGGTALQLDPHVHLLGAVENGLWAESFFRDSDVKAFDDILEHPWSPTTVSSISPTAPATGSNSTGTHSKHSGCRAGSDCSAERGVPAGVMDRPTRSN